MARLSVVVAARNHERFIREQILSVLNQTFQDMEIIVVDDGSTDSTPEIAQEYSGRLRVIRQEQAGVVEARMRGFVGTSAPYVCFLDSDDCIEPWRFEKQVAALEADETIGLVYGDAWIIDEEGRRIGRFSGVYPAFEGDVAARLFDRYCFIPGVTAMFRRNVFLRTGPLSGPGPICDYLKWIEIAGISRVARLDEPLGSWRRHASSVSLSADREQSNNETIAALRQLLVKHPDLAERLGWRARRRFGRLHFITAFFAALDDDWAGARRYFRNSIAEFPVAPENWAGLVLALLPWRAPARAVFNAVYRKIYKWR